MSIQPNKDAPELVLKRAITWLTLLVDMADIEPADTSIKVSIAGGGEVLAEVTLADDMAALERIAGSPAIRLADFDEARLEA